MGEGRETEAGVGGSESPEGTTRGGRRIEQHKDRGEERPRAGLGRG